jgi:hypothetical protein
VTAENDEHRFPVACSSPMTEPDFGRTADIQKQAIHQLVQERETFPEGVSIGEN